MERSSEVPNIWGREGVLNSSSVDDIIELMTL